MEVKLLKLVSGEEVISEIRYSDNHVVLVDPLMVAVAPQGVALMPWIMLTKETEIEIHDENIICLLDVNDEILNAYKKQTGKGVVSTGGLIT